ncbi:Mu transposase C-terminal domain-containing protein [Streptomyces muensis]|uniref:Mu transposase C-terminal domain-containing protein n=1 Tax=Streptomyces muensis TaxID=1077944 RepID=A0A9X1PZ41_STRM4|nr:Mu transposase C-terminal domain-containing protein [Streptomyces muensis]MCF1596032.1 Mu transposase C-terminal domain-containing protein [Streptomyces muensis]
MLLTLMSDDTRQGHTASANEYRRFVGRMLDTFYGSGAVPLPSRSTFQRLVKAVREQHGAALGVTVIDKKGIRLSRPGERVHVGTFRLALPAHLARPSLRSVQITVAVDELTLTICTLMVHPSPHKVDGPTLLARLCGPPAARTVSGSGEEREVGPLILPESLVLDGLRMRRERAFLDGCRAMGIRVDTRRPVKKAAHEHITGRLAALFGAELMALTRPPAHDDSSLIIWLQDRAERWAESVWRHQPQAGLQGMGGQRHATPSSAYEACVARLGWVHLPLGGHVVRRLLPSVTRRVTDRGVLVKGHRYVYPRLASLQAADPVEVRFDPYDPRQVWVRTDTESWLQVPLAGNALGRLSSWGLWMSPDATRRVLPDVPARRPSPALDSVQERLSYHAQLPVLRTPFLQEVLRLGDRLAVLNRRPGGGRQGLLITGPPRSGKTTALRELSQHVPRMSIGSHPLGPAVYLRLHPTDSDRTALLRLGKLVGLPPFPRRTSTAAASEAVQEALIASETSLVLVDDAFPEAPIPRASSPVETLRFLADQVPALFVYADEDREETPFTPDQGARQGRLAHVRAAPVPYGPDWGDLVETLDKALRLRHHQPGSLLRLAPALHHRTGGWAGALAHLVRSASIDAILSGREEITERDFDSITV